MYCSEAADGVLCYGRLILKRQENNLLKVQMDSQMNNADAFLISFQMFPSLLLTEVSERREGKRRRAREKNG